MKKLILTSLLVLLCACKETPVTGTPPEGEEENQEQTDGETPTDPQPEPEPEPEEPTSSWLPDEKIPLDAFGENFQAGIASPLARAKYMERTCVAATGFSAWEDLPLRRCKYSSMGQSVEVVMLNPGPRRLTAWLQDACKDLAKDYSLCMEKTYKHIIYQSGAQFPVGGVVIEDMDGNGRGNAYAFRNGVTIRIAAFSTGTESILSATQVARSYTDAASATYSYARPVSVTREQLTRYASASKLAIPALGTSSERKNVFNEVIGQFYRDSWKTNKSHILRAWVYAQGF